MTSLLSVKSLVNKKLGLSGLMLEADACTYLAELLSALSEGERREWIKKISQCLLSGQGSNLKSCVVSRAEMESAVFECTTGGAGSFTEDSSVFQLIPAFQFPRFIYLSERKKFVSDIELKIPRPVLFGGDPAGKSTLFLHRYDVIKQRVLRDKLFRPPSNVTGANKQEERAVLSTVEYLLTTKAAKSKSVFVLGMVVMIREGEFTLEDPTGSVPVDFSQAVFKSGIFTQGNIIIVDGTFTEGVLHVRAIAHPTIEMAKDSMSYFGNVNFFGGTSKTSAKFSDKMKFMEESNAAASLVFCSNIFLDHEDTFDNLRKLFDGFSQCAPVAFVFTGNFLSKARGKDTMKKLMERLQAFAVLLEEFKPLFKTSKLVLIPGPEEAYSSVIYPKPAFPSVLRKYFSKFDNVLFGTNPARIQYCTQEIVIYREDLLHRMFRNSIHVPQCRSGDEMGAQLAKTVLAQAHLAPLPLNVSPVYWEYDYTMRLYPVPDLLVMADKCECYSTTNSCVTVTNPGNFSGNGNNPFAVYFPQTRELQLSQLNFN